MPVARTWFMFFFRILLAPGFGGSYDISYTDEDYDMAIGLIRVER